MSTVSPKTADPAVRMALIESAARLLADQGPGALTTRALAREVGTSTMAVYTYFGSMADLRRAVRHEGFQRLADRLDAVPRHRDPVVHLAALGAAYFANGIANPHLYRVMFQEEPVTEDDGSFAYSTFERLVVAVARCVEQERFAANDPTLIATQLWAMTHGVVSLRLASLLTAPAAVECAGELAVNLFVALGERPSTARAATRTAARTLQ
jgi:AcrR family transcriptional regulator